VDVGVAGAGHHTVAGKQQVPGLEQVAHPGQRKDDAEQDRKMGDGLATWPDHEADRGLTRGAREGAAGTERPAGSKGTAWRSCGLLGGLGRALLRLDEPAHGAVDDDRNDQACDERTHDQAVDGLPGRQREHVEADVVVEDRITGAEAHAVQGTLEQQPVARHAHAENDGDERRDDEAPAAQGLDRVLVDVLDDVYALEGAMTGREASGELDVGVEDGEEDDAGRYPDDQARPDLTPVDDAQTYLAEPQPVGVGVEVDDKQHASKRHERHDDADDSTAMMGCRCRWLLRHVVDLGHGASMADAGAACVGDVAIEFEAGVATGGDGFVFRRAAGRVIDSCPLPQGWPESPAPSANAALGGAVVAPGSDLVADRLGGLRPGGPGG